MSTTVAAPPKKKSRLNRTFWITGLLLVIAVALVFWYLNSDSFRDSMRSKIIAELERTTGGKVEMQSLTWKLSTLHFDVRGLTIHGTEGPTDAPYVHADDISVDARIVSFLSRKLALSNVAIDRLTVHLIVYPNGSTNQPRPRVATVNGQPAAEQLFNLAVTRIEIADGTLILNEEKVPFSVTGERLTANLGYSQKDQGYDGSISASLLSARWRNLPPQRADIDLHLLLRTNEAEIRSMRISNQHSSVQASGTVRDFHSPRVLLQYNASLELPEVAKLAKVPELRAGHADVKGGLSYESQRYASQGSLSLRGVEWKDETLHLAGMDGASPFSLTPEKLAFPRLGARVLGGTARGAIEITNWNRSGKKSPAQKGTADLQLSGLQMKDAVQAISTPSLRLDRIPVVGAASGNIKANWTGTPANAVADLKLDVDPPANPAPEQLPLTAQLRARYRGDGDILDVGTLNAATRSIRVNATGQLGSESAQAKVAFNATDLRELRPVLAVLSPGTRIPVLVEGRASYNGVIAGRLKALSTRGRLDMEGFDTEAAPLQLSSSGAPATRTQRIHWDSLISDLSYSPSSLGFQHGVLRRGDAEIDFSGTSSLREGRFNENSSQLDFTLHVQQASVEDLQTLAGLKYPLSGTLNGDLHASGTPQNLRSNGNVQVANLTAYGEPFRQFRSHVQFAGSDVQFTDIWLVHNGAQMSGMLGYNLSDRHFRFDLTGSNIELASLRQFEFKRLSMAGKAGFHITGSGTQEAPVINGQVDVRNLVLNKELVGSLTVYGETRGSDLVLRGRSEFQDADLTMDGTIQMRGDYPGEMKIYFSKLDFDPLIRAYFQGQITGHSSIAGTIDIHGPFKRPRDLVITGIARQLFADVQNIKLRNDGPVRFTMDGEVARLEQFHLVGDSNDAYVQGTVQIAGARAVDLHTHGQLDLKLLQGYNRDVIASGPVSFTIDIGGTASHPQMGGRFDLNNASISLTDLPNGLSEINGTLVFAQDRIQIQKLTAHTGGGELNVGGFLAYRNGLYFDLTATGKDVRLRYPPGVSSSADATLRYTGSAKSSLLSGDIVVTRFGMNPQFDFANYLAQSRKTPTLATLNPFLDNLRLDIHITSTPELQVETSLARLSGDLDLHVRGTAARPAVLGRVNIAEGDVFFNGTRYRLERGDITFSNPLTIEPVVNLEMSARVQDYDITIGLHGAATGGKNLSMTYRSDPPLSNADIIALLAFGRTRSAQDIYTASQPGQAGSDTANASNAILGQALNSTFSDRVQRLFGASRVKIDPLYVSQLSGNNPTPRVTIEQQINKNVTLTYITSVTQQAQTVVQVEYNINKDVSIVAVRDENGVLGFDVHVRRRKK